MASVCLIANESDAKTWLKNTLDVSLETMEKLSAFVRLLHEEAKHQNLIAPSTIPHMWTRHIVDSAQLLPLAKSQASPSHTGKWLDLGTGAGFPGMVIAIISNWNVIMVESRSRRANYLHRVTSRLELGRNTKIIGKKLEHVDTFQADVISARAFAPLERLLHLSARFSTETTMWLLPKGQSATKELAGLDDHWRHMFHVKHSVTDASARILAGHLLGGPKIS